MLSFVGWEAVAPLTGRLRAGQLSRVIGTAFTVTALLYLGLAIATVSCLGRGADLAVPLADLLQLAVGPAGRAVAAAAALVLTAGSVNAYLSGATEMLRELSAVRGQIGPNGPPHPPRLSAHLFLVGIALAGLALIGMSALRLADTAVLVSVPTTMFLCVYLSCTVSATRMLTGSPARSESPTACRRARASRAGSRTRPREAATSVLADSNEESSWRSRSARTCRSAGDSADSSRSSLARCTGATRSKSSSPLPVS